MACGGSTQSRCDFSVTSQWLVTRKSYWSITGTSQGCHQCDMPVEGAKCQYIWNKSIHLIRFKLLFIKETFNVYALFTKLISITVYIKIFIFYIMTCSDTKYILTHILNIFHSMTWHCRFFLLQTQSRHWGRNLTGRESFVLLELFLSPSTKLKHFSVSFILISIWLKLFA